MINARKILLDVALEAVTILAAKRCKPIDCLVCAPVFTTSIRIIDEGSIENRFNYIAQRNDALRDLDMAPH